MSTAELTEYRGCTIKIGFDDDVESPFEWDNEPTFITWTPRYQQTRNNKAKWSEDPETLFEQLKETPDVYAYAVRAYIHSGVTVSLGPRLLNDNMPKPDASANTYPFNDCWDSGWFGVLIFTRKHLEGRFGKEATDDNAQTLVEGFVETWDKYLTGQVYWFDITDPKGESIDSCGGMYDEPKDIIEQCKHTIDSYWRDEHPLLPPEAVDQMEFKKVVYDTSLHKRNSHTA